ncbi:MAG: hypothetical protein U5L04_01730 [Trueperaceae bacterium]|nr:hypothetical protein [Trueperaceae bacterium]
MDELRELGWDLEPVVAREVKSTSKAGLVAEIIDAVDEGGKQARQVLAVHFPDLASDDDTPSEPADTDTAHTPRWTEEDTTTGTDALKGDDDMELAESQLVPTAEDNKDDTDLDQLLGSHDDLKRQGPNRRHANGYLVGPEDTDVVLWVKADPPNNNLRRGDLVPFPTIQSRAHFVPHAWLSIAGALAVLERREGRVNLRCSQLENPHWNELRRRIAEDE